tara:strand:+ start:559 stop:1071 length:513 start_codon:yes stop_codon:yes gene_type:complete
VAALLCLRRAGDGALAFASALVLPATLLAFLRPVPLPFWWAAMLKPRPIWPTNRGAKGADWPRMAEAWGCPGPESATAGAAWRRIWPNWACFQHRWAAPPEPLLLYHAAIALLMSATLAAYHAAGVSGCLEARAPVRMSAVPPPGPGGGTAPGGGLVVAQEGPRRAYGGI